MGYKSTFLGYIKLPTCTNNVGTCDYDNICGKLERLVEEHGCNAETLLTYGLTIPGDRCTCPLPAATIKLAYNDIPLGRISATYRSLANGDYKVEGRMYERGNEVACFRAFLSIRA